MNNFVSQRLVEWSPKCLRPLWLGGYLLQWSWKCYTYFQFFRWRFLYQKDCFIKRKLCTFLIRTPKLLQMDKITSLYLLANHLWGSIPLKTMRCHYATTVCLSHNLFNGSITSHIGCANALNLSHNFLVGDFFIQGASNLVNWISVIIISLIKYVGKLVYHT